MSLRFFPRLMHQSLYLQNAGPQIYIVFHGVNTGVALGRPRPAFSRSAIQYIGGCDNSDLAVVPQGKDEPTDC